jgi:hypothetical protein
VEAACSPEIPDAINPPKAAVKSSTANAVKDSSPAQPKKTEDKKSAKRKN